MYHNDIYMYKYIKPLKLFHLQNPYMYMHMLIVITFASNNIDIGLYLEILMFP